MNLLRPLLGFLASVCGVSAIADTPETPLPHYRPWDVDVVMLGDSNTWIGGDDCSKPRGWNHWFARIAAPRSCRSYARSGATWTHTPATVVDPADSTAILTPNNVIAAQVARLSRDIAAGTTPVPGLIIISAGTNDAMFRNRRPHALADKEPHHMATIDRAIAVNVDSLRSLAPEAMIVVLTPIQCVKIAPDVLSRYTDAISRAAGNAGATVVRQDDPSLIDARAERLKRRMTYDGIHTSAAGARRCAEHLAATLHPLVVKQ